MKSNNRLSLAGIYRFLAAGLLLLLPAPARAQKVTATVPVGAGPYGLAANPVTNKVYVAVCGAGTVSVIDGATNSTIAIPAGLCPTAVAVNPATNKIYVANIGRKQEFGYYAGGSVTIIDGAANSTTTLDDPHAPRAIAVNPTTNKIYVANSQGNNVTVIDGDTNSTTTVTGANALGPVAVAVNPVTNRIYVANQGSSLNGPGNVTVIDGATNSTTTVTDPNAISPNSVAVNAATNKIYVANTGGNSLQGNVTVIDGATNSTTTVTDPNALAPGGPDGLGFGVAVDPTTDKTYVVNEASYNVTVIDGATNSTTTVTDPNAVAPIAVAVNEATNTVYVANAGCSDTETGCFKPGSVTVIDGATNAVTTVVDPNANAPRAVVVNPATDEIYVPNASSSNVTVIEGGASPTTHSLSVTLAGSGSGTVTSRPSGIVCGSSCSASFATGTTVSLTFSPASGSTFAGWSEACAGTGSCSVTMNGDELITATFNVPPPDLSLGASPSNMSVTAGGSVSTKLSITPAGGFNQSVALTCSGAPSAATCTISPASVTPNGTNAVTATLTVTTTARSTTPVAPWTNPTIHGEQWVLVCLALVLGLTLWARMVAGLFRPRPLAGLALTVTFLLIVLWAGCGGGNTLTGGFGNQGTPAGTYSLNHHRHLGKPESQQYGEPDRPVTPRGTRVA